MQAHQPLLLVHFAPRLQGFLNELNETCSGKERETVLSLFPEKAMDSCGGCEETKTTLAWIFLGKGPSSRHQLGEFLSHPPGVGVTFVQFVEGLQRIKGAPKKAEPRKLALTANEESKLMTRGQ